MDREREGPKSASRCVEVAQRMWHVWVDQLVLKRGGKEDTNTTHFALPSFQRGCYSSLTMYTTFGQKCQQLCTCTSHHHNVQWCIHHRCLMQAVVTLFNHSLVYFMELIKDAALNTPMCHSNLFLVKMCIHDFIKCLHMIFLVYIIISNTTKSGF